MKKSKHKPEQDRQPAESARKKARPIRLKRQAGKAEKLAVYLEEAEPLPKR